MGEIKILFHDWLFDFSKKMSASTNEIVVTVEGPVFLQNPKVSADISRSIYAVEIACIELFSPCFEYQNTTWKKHVLGNGSCSKEDILKFSQIKWGRETFKVQDHADAACIALHQLLLLSIDDKTKGVKPDGKKHKNHNK